MESPLIEKNMSSNLKDIVVTSQKFVLEELNYHVPLSVINQLYRFFIDQIQDRVAEGQKVTIYGFGTFNSYVFNAREGEADPITGKPFYVPAHYVPSFRTGNTFRQRVAVREVPEELITTHKV